MLRISSCLHKANKKSVSKRTIGSKMLFLKTQVQRRKLVDFCFYYGFKHFRFYQWWEEKIF